MHITYSNLKNLAQIIKDTELENYQVKQELFWVNRADTNEIDEKTEKEDYISGLLEYCNKFTDF